MVKQGPEKAAALGFSLVMGADRRSKGSFEVREPRVMTNPRAMSGYDDRRRAPLGEKITG